MESCLSAQHHNWLIILLENGVKGMITQLNETGKIERPK